MANFNLNIVNALIFLILGFSCGVISGFFGVGGSFILTPFLNILGLPMTNAVGTGLAYSVVSSSVGGVKHFIKKNVNLKIAIIVGVFAVIGVKISYPLIIYLNSLNKAGLYIRVVYIALLLTMGILPLIKKEKNGDCKTKQESKKSVKLPPKIKMDDTKEVSLWSLIFIGLFVGFLRGYGVGVGFISVPLFITVLNMNCHKAVGTSLVVVLISCVYATYLYTLSGMIFYFAVIFLVIGAIPGINIGVKAIVNIADDILSRFFSCFLLMSSFGIILKQFQLQQLSLIYTSILVSIVVLTIIIRYYLQIKLPFFKTIKFKKMK